MQQPQRPGHGAKETADARKNSVLLYSFLNSVPPRRCMAALNVSVTRAAEVLGGPAAAATWQDLHDTVTPAATGMNVVVARWAVALTCVNYSDTLQLMAIGGKGVYRQGQQEGQGLNIGGQIRG